MTRYTLPELNWKPSALEPHLSAQLISLHHTKHHAAYVKNANAALDKLDAARTAKDFEALPNLERVLAFNVAGHVLHSIYWENLSPTGGGEPKGALAEALARDFGDFAAFKATLNGCAEGVMGSGWAALVYEPKARRLLVTQLHDHQDNQLPGSSVLMLIDAWEHAYYLQYHHEKAKAFEALWNVWAWPDIGARYQAAAGR